MDVIDVVASSINVTISWYFIAWLGLTPAKIRPLIIPGRVTIPRVFAESILGIMPVFIESLIIFMEDNFVSAPRESFVSTSSFLSLNFCNNEL